jgi:hypothetical protein
MWSMYGIHGPIAINQTGRALEPYAMVLVSSQTDARYGCAG